MLDNSFELYYYYAENNWWFLGKWMVVHSLLRRALLHCPKPRILDLGCGTGEIIKRLSLYGDGFGVDLSMEALTYSYLRGCDQLLQADLQHPPFPDETFDVVVILDMFEHLPDDVGAMRRFARLLKKGGYMIITTPAMPSLWSVRDEWLHHHRRYQRHELQTIVTMAGMQIERLFYSNFLLHPIVWAKYKLERIRKKPPIVKYDLVVLPKPLNWAITKILWFETKILEKIDLPLGSSLACLARRR